MKEDTERVKLAKFHSARAIAQSEVIEKIAYVAMVIGIMASVSTIIYGIYILPSDVDVILERATRTTPICVMAAGCFLLAATAAISSLMFGFSCLLNLAAVGIEDPKNGGN
jgi:hypothetical protein